MTLAIVLPNWIGDVVMATPAIRALRNNFPDCEFIGVMRPYVHGLLSGLPWLDRTVFFDRKSKKTEHSLWSAAGRLRRSGVERIVICPHSTSAALLARLSGARRRFQHSMVDRYFLHGRLLASVLNRTPSSMESPVDCYLRLAYAAGCPRELRQLELATEPSDEVKADAIWRDLNLDQTRHVVLLNSGGAFGSAKHWPQSHFVALAQRIVRQHDASILVLCGPKEAAIAESIEQDSKHPRVRSMARQDLSLQVAKACIRRASLMVSTDSGLRHVAAGFQTPIVTLFGPMDARCSQNYHVGETQLFHPIECRPCGKWVCPLEHHACMRDLSVDRVYAEVAQKLRECQADEAAA